jgi:hypothetical protein
MAGKNLAFVVDQMTTPLSFRLGCFTSEGLFRQEAGRVWRPGGEIQQPQVNLHRSAAIEVTVSISTSADKIVSFLNHCLDTQHKNMAAVSGNNHEIRNKIKQVQELLDQEIERVNDLKKLLSIAEEKVTRLTGELDEYHARITPTPINSCPAEILSMIFRLSITEDYDSRHMGRLLLVYKRWYTLVVNDPQMWNTVNISTPTRWDMRSWSDSTRLYVKSCIERNRATSLSINLNFILLQTTKQQLVERLRYGFFNSHHVLQQWMKATS